MVSQRGITDLIPISNHVAISNEVALDLKESGAIRIFM